MKEPIINGRYAGSHVWDPSPEALQRIARLAAEIEAAVRAGKIVEYYEQREGGAR